MGARDAVLPSVVAATGVSLHSPTSCCSFDERLKEDDLLWCVLVQLLKLLVWDGDVGFQNKKWSTRSGSVVEKTVFRLRLVSRRWKRVLDLTLDAFTADVLLFDSKNVVSAWVSSGANAVVPCGQQQKTPGALIWLARCVLVGHFTISTGKEQGQEQEGVMVALAHGLGKRVGVPLNFHSSLRASHHALTSLDLSRCTRLVAISSRCFCTIPLRHLRVDGCSGLVCIGREAFRFAKLEEK